MPTYDFKCSKCSFVGEKNVPLAQFDVIQECPECKETSYERQFSTSSGRNFTFNCLVYENTYGKKAWKRNLSQLEQAKVLNDERSPY